jgi:hypothetical protein
MAEQGGHGGRGRPVTVESLWKLTLVAALVVAVAQWLLAILDTLVSGGTVDGDFIITVLFGNLASAVGDAAVFGAITAIVVLGTSRALLIRAGGAIYAAEVVDDLLNFAVDSVFASFNPSLDIGLFVDPLYRVIFVVGIAMAYRLYQGQTILPNVDYRL